MRPRPQAKGGLVIVSHTHRFIFLKTRKTAGTSVEIALSQVCGPGDIITPITSEDEVVRQRTGGRGPQNHALPLRSYTVKDVGKLVIRRQRAEAYHHMPAKEVRRLVGRDVWDSYFKFSIERNPWDAAVSLYYWRTRNLERRPSFSQFVGKGGLDPLRSNEQIYRIHGAMAADKVCLYERLADDLEGVRLALGLPEALELPRTKANTGRNRRPYQEFYDEDTREMVRQMFAAQISTFDYTF